MAFTFTGNQGYAGRSGTLKIESNARNLMLWIGDIEMILGAGMGAFMRTAMDPYLRRTAASYFRQQGGPGAGQAVIPWQPLEPATEQIRIAQGYQPGPINDRSGEMKRFITQQPNPQILSGPGLATMFWPGAPSNQETAKKLRTAAGGKAQPKTPPRPVIGVTQSDVVNTISLLSAWFTLQCQMLHPAP